MITADEIHPGHFLKVLVNYDDIDEELFARVEENTGTTFEVTYLSPTSKTYKGACVHMYDEQREIVGLESITEHHEDFPFVEVNETMFVLEEEIDTDEDSDIVDSEDESESDDSFIVGDDDIDGEVHPPENSREIDAAWDAWHPSSPGSRRFKDMVNRIEQHARSHADNLNF